jgi:hypothetical protein
MFHRSAASLLIAVCVSYMCGGLRADLSLSMGAGLDFCSDVPGKGALGKLGR